MAAGANPNPNPNPNPSPNPNPNPSPNPNPDPEQDFKKRAHEEVVRLQSGDGSSRYAWGQICDVSRREFEKVYGRLEVKLTEVGESFYNEYIPPVLEHLQQTGAAPG